MRPWVESTLAAVRRLADVELDGDEARVRSRAELVARFDLRHHRVLVRAPQELIPSLRRVFPSSRATPEGIVFDLTRSDACPEAVAAIRKRLEAQRLVAQSRVASP
jgi:hypothetical protein